MILLTLMVSASLIGVGSIYRDTLRGFHVRLLNSFFVRHSLVLFPVGYQFVNILYRGDDGKLKVDKDLINDVRVQEGGGGEPLI